MSGTMTASRAKVGEAYETNPQCDFYEVVLIIGPVPDGYMQKHIYADRYHLCARLFMEKSRWDDIERMVVLDDGELEQWYRRIS